MSCGCPSLYSFTCPEIVPVTVQQNIVNIDGSPAMHRSEVFEYGDATDHKTFGLAYFPYEPRSVNVARGSGVQIYGVDFTVQGQYLVLTNPLLDVNPPDKIFVTYLHVAGTIPSQASAVGSILATAGTTLDGYLRMDGTTSYAWADYDPLHDWFYEDSGGGEPAATRQAALLLSDDGTNFVLKLLQDVTYSGTDLVTMYKFIKT